MISSIIDAAGRYYRTVLAILTGLLAGGILAFEILPKESFPDLSLPFAYVSLHQDGISPEDSCELLIKPMETELNSLSGLDEIIGTCYEGGGNIVVAGDISLDADDFLDEVRLAVDQANAELPDAADEPRVTEINLSDEFPNLLVNLYGDIPLGELTTLSEDLADAIKEVPGVLDVELNGTRTRQTEIVVSPGIFEAYNITLSEIANNVAISNANLPAGTAVGGNGNTTLTFDTGWDTLSDVANAPVRVSGESPLLVSQIAGVRETYADATSATFNNGRPAISLQINRESGANQVRMIDQVRQVADDFIATGVANGSIPPSVSVAYSQDASVDVRILLNSLINNVAFSVLLVMVVIVLVLGLRTGMLVGVAIPGSYVIGFLFLLVGGYSLNIVVLFSLILASGMLVDGAVVVTEFAAKRMAVGVPRDRAYREAAKRMAWPIISSTLTTLVAFAPMLFWPDVTGEFMSYMPITLLVTLSGSLLMALIFIPVLGEHLETFLRFLFGAGAAGFAIASMSGGLPMLGAALVFVLAAVFVPPFIRSTGEKSNVTQEPDSSETSADESQAEVKEIMDLNAFDGFTRGYVSLLRGALSMPLVIFGLVIAVVMAVMTAFMSAGVSGGFFPEVEPQFASVSVRARGNLSIDQKVELVRGVESIILDMQAERGEFHSITSNITTASDASSDTIGTIFFEYVDWEIRERSAYEINAELRERVQDIAGLVIEVGVPAAGPPVGKDLQIRLTTPNDNLELMNEAAALISEHFNEIGLVDIDDGLDVPAAEFRLVPNEALALRYGVNLTELGTYLRAATEGVALASYRPDGGDEQDVVLRFPSEFRNVSDILALSIQTPQGAIPIANFVELETVRRVGVISRVDQQTEVTVAANLPETSEQTVAELVEQEAGFLAELREQGLIPASLEFEFLGADEEQQESMAFLGQAMMVAVVIIAFILVTQFNSFYYAGLVLTAILLSTVGVLLGLIIVPNAVFNIMVMIGVLALAGIVVNNNIVLIDTYIILRRQLSPKTFEQNMQVVLLTGAQRLRPVLLTTVTTILGLLPMSLGVNLDFATGLVTVGAPSSQWWNDLARAVVFGLSFATVLTLVFTPTMLLLPSFVKALVSRDPEVRNPLQWAGAFSSELLGAQPKASVTS